MTREPVFAGQFYPSSPQALKDEIASMVDKQAEKEDAIGVFSPHAGYLYSGYVAGILFSNIKITDTVVILGPSHTGVGPVFSLYTKGSWRTPFGEVGIDEELCCRIEAGCDLIKADETAHMQEHSIEVQLPFMQYFAKDFKIVPMVVSNSDLKACEKVAEAIASSIKESKGKVLIVASGDMTHYEPQEDAQKKDNLAIDAMLKLDEKLLLERVRKYSISMCGAITATIMLLASKYLGAKEARLIKYQTSGEITGDYSAVVGYAGLVVR